MFSWFKVRTTVNTDEKKINELLTRGVDELIHYDSLKQKLQSGVQLRVKLGIDPTSPHIHLGRAIPLLKLKDFQDLGHQAVLVIGDGTGVIGDTSDKESERPMLSEAQVRENMKSYFDQAARILDINSVEKRRNSTWLNKLSYDEIGTHADQFSVADFIARDNIKRRLDEGKRVSLREVLYPLMQGYDSVALNADIELGGTDQRFNLLAGRTLQSHFNQKPQDIVMTPLIEGIDGRKMSSSWGNTVNITDTPYDMYAKIMRADDSVIPMYLTNLTRIPQNEVEEIVNGLREGTQNPRDAKMYLAHTIVSQFHSTQSAEKAQEEFVNIATHDKVPQDIPTVTAKPNELLIDTLVRHELIPSKTTFRRLVREGAIHNRDTNKKITNENITSSPGVYKIGKHRFVRIM